jgi:branched-chain amino acid transport system permease protein
VWRLQVRRHTPDVDDDEIHAEALMLFLSLLVAGVMQGAPIALAAIGFALIWYTTKEFHFLYGTLLATSGFMLYSLAGAGLNVWLAAVIVVVVVGAFGAALENWAYIPLKDPLSVLLFSFGLAIVLQNGLQMIYGPQGVVLESSLRETAVTVIPGTVVRAQLIEIVAVGILIVVAVAVTWWLKRSRTGLAVRAVMKDEEVAAFVGIRPRRIRVLAYAIGSAVGAIGGVFMMISSGTSPTSGFDVMLFAFMATFLAAGSMGRVPWWGMAIGIALNVVAWKLPANFNTLIVFTIMLIYVVVRERASGWALRRKFARQQAAELTGAGAGR